MFKIRYYQTVVSYTTITTIKQYVDLVTITFEPQLNGSCLVKGYSRAKYKHTVFDYGKNYCNLKKHMKDLNGYIETTSNKICTQYSKAVCN